MVTAASWVRGTFYGKAKPGAKASDPKSYMKFTVGSDGKVSGKLKYKNKWRPFTSSLSYCTMSSAELTPTVKIGKSKFKPGKVTITRVEMDDLVLAEASDMGGAFVAQKKPGLVKKEMPLDELIGKSYKITKSDNSKLGLKKGDKLVVKLGNGDKATVTGVVGGKKLSSISWVLLASSKSGDVYTVYVDIIAPGLKRDCTLVLTATLDGNGILQNRGGAVRQVDHLIAFGDDNGDVVQVDKAHFPPDVLHAFRRGAWHRISTMDGTDGDEKPPAGLAGIILTRHLRFQGDFCAIFTNANLSYFSLGHFHYLLDGFLPLPLVHIQQGDVTLILTVENHLREF